MIALVYGLVCIAVAFLAQFLGGVLQASLTIFGVVGGPLLALFSLGMFTTIANQKGALTGLVFGLAMSLWIAFGGPKPPLPKLPVRVDGCNETFSVYTPILYEHSHYIEEKLGQLKDDGEYFWLYRLSYLYNGVVGLLSTFIVGLIVSFIVSKIMKEETKSIDPNLFIPPLANMIRKRKEALNSIESSQEDTKPIDTP